MWFVLLAGCHGGRLGGASDADPPTITLTSPQAGEGRYGSVVTATYEVEGLRLDADAIGKSDEDGVGHVHAYLDGELVGETADTTFDFTDVLSGDHTLAFALATNGHDEIGEPTEIQLPTRIPTLTVESPVDGTAYSTSVAPFVFALDDFDVSAQSAFGDPAFGGGRIQVLVDDQIVDLGLDPSTLEVSPLHEGPHRVTFELADADGTPIDPPVSDDVDVSVAVGTPAVSIDRAPYLEPYGSAAVPLAVAAWGATLDYHVYVDGVFAKHATTPEVQLLHLAPGYHYVELRLVSGTSELPIHDHAHVYVTADRPDVRFTSPGDQWGVASDLDVTAEPENFTLDPDIGGAANPGHGHLTVLVDGVEAGSSATGTVHLSGLTSGPHELRMELRENDGQPLNPPVYDVITVSVG